MVSNSWPRVRRASGACCSATRQPDGDTTMRFMIIVRATPMTEAGAFPPDKDKVFAAMAEYHEQLAQAGALLDASGLQPSAKGWRISYDGSGRRTVVDGPFA